MIATYKNTILSNEIVQKIGQLEQQHRKYKCVAYAIMPVKISSYSCLYHTYAVSFYLPQNTSAINQKKILALAPQGISYFSKGEPLCLSKRLSSKGVEYSLLYLAILSVACEYIPRVISEYLIPKDLFNCRHFALGFALDVFKPKDINSIDKLKSNKFFQETPDSNRKNLDVLATNTYPIITYYSNTIDIKLKNINENQIKAIIELLHTVGSISSEYIQKIERLLRENLDPQTKKLKTVSMELATEIRNNMLLGTMILTVNPWNGSIGLSATDKAKMADIYQHIYSSSVVESTRFLNCYSISSDNFASRLARICHKLQKSGLQTINYLWLTENHVMVFKINNIGNSFKISFYDPGVDTSRVANILVNSLEDILSLNINAFIKEENQIVCKIKQDTIKNNLLHSSFLIPVNLTDDEYKQYCSAEVIELVNNNKKHKNITDKKEFIHNIIDLTTPD
jgi:hypothetical protein